MLLWEGSRQKHLAAKILKSLGGKSDKGDGAGGGEQCISLRFSARSFACIVLKDWTTASRTFRNEEKTAVVQNPDPEIVAGEEKL